MERSCPHARGEPITYVSKFLSLKSMSLLIYEKEMYLPSTVVTLSLAQALHHKSPKHYWKRG